MRFPRVLLATLGTLSGLTIAEMALRAWPPGALGAFHAREHGARHPFHPERGIYVLDAELGYRPVPGGKGYGPHGALRNEYSLERPSGPAWAGGGGRRRLLFLGDSATHRGALVEGFRSVFGDEGYEYWNAGVEGYDTTQECGYYRRFLGGVAEDHVILTFHLNDWVVTPVLFMEGERLHFVRVGLPEVDVDGWLFRRSHLYRLYLAQRVRWRAFSELRDGLERKIESGLAELRELAARRGSRLTVLVLPWLAEPGDWRPEITVRHTRTLRVLERLRIEHHDLLPVLTSALADGVPLASLAEDELHPSDLFGRRAAQELRRRGLVP